MAIEAVVNQGSDPSKQAQEVFVSCKINKVYYQLLLLNKSTSQQLITQTHLTKYLDKELLGC